MTSTRNCFKLSQSSVVDVSFTTARWYARRSTDSGRSSTQGYILESVACGVHAVVRSRGFSPGVWEKTLLSIAGFD